MDREIGLHTTKLEAYLREKRFIKIKTPMFLPFLKVLPYLSEENVNAQVKVQGPKGETLLMRGDTTVAMVVGECIDSLTDRSTARVFYDESHFQYDFEKQDIREDRQIGLEVIGSNVQNAFSETLGYAIELASMTCETNTLVEVSLPFQMLEVIEQIASETHIKAEQLMYYVKRKNVHEVTKLLKTAATVFQNIDINLEMLSRLLTTPCDVSTFIAESERIPVLKPIQNSLLQMAQISGVRIEYNPTITVDKPYYSQATFKIYDTEKHEAFISGGSYRFEDYGLSGCGFSVQLGGIR